MKLLTLDIRNPSGLCDCRGTAQTACPRHCIDKHFPDNGLEWYTKSLTDRVVTAVLVKIDEITELSGNVLQSRK